LWVELPLFLKLSFSFYRFLFLLVLQHGNFIFKIL
jgi:hypothetical protein